MEIAFRDVKLGQKFTSHRSKRFFGGVKVAPTEVSSEGTVQALEKPTYIGNAVILTGYPDALAPDAGTLIIVDDDDVVEV